MNDLITVIVPVYNVEPYLEKCVTSICSQTYHNLEIFLVDDGSPDNCPAMCDEFAKKDWFRRFSDISGYQNRHRSDRDIYCMMFL